MAEKFKPLPKSEAEVAMEHNLAVMQAVSKGFVPQGFTPQMIAETKSYYQKHGAEMRELLDLGAKLRAEGKQVETKALKAIEDAPHAIEHVYMAGVGGGVGVLGIPGKLIMDYTLAGDAIKGVTKLITGKDLQTGTWGEVGQMFTGSYETAKATAAAYEELSKSYRDYEIAINRTYVAYKDLVAAVNSGDSAAAEKASAALNSRIERLQHSRGELVSAINHANEVGAAYRGLEGQADKFVVESAVTVATSVVGGAAIEAGVKGAVHGVRGVKAGIEASRAGAGVVESTKAGWTAARQAAEVSEAVAAAGEATTGAVRATTQAVKATAQVAKTAETVSVTAGNVGYKTYEITHSVSKKQEDVWEVTTDRSEQTRVSQSQEFSI